MSRHRGGHRNRAYKEVGTEIWYTKRWAPKYGGMHRGGYRNRAYIELGIEIGHAYRLASKYGIHRVGHRNMSYI